MIYLLLCCLFCGLFMVFVAIGTGGKEINGIFFYPKPVQDRAVELGLTTYKAIKSMNWYDGIVIDRLWVGHSQFWDIPQLKGMTYVRTWKQVLMKRGVDSLLYVVIAAVAAGIIVLIF